MDSKSSRLSIENFDIKSLSSELGEEMDSRETNTNGSWEYFLPKFSKNQIVKHTYYTLSYNEKAEQAEWLAYELKKEYLKNRDFKRPYFVEDPLVRTGSADWRNYKKSGYDKGHLCPAADMEFHWDAYNDTFYTSNIAPQNREFNGGIWNRLEQKVRYWAAKNNGVMVVTGGILTNTSKTIGAEKVVVPDYFYKIIFENEKGKHKMIAFLMPNEKSKKALYEYVVSVDSIEVLTGIDFFPNLEDKLEDELEKNTDYKFWISN
ncbi:DNA/RNA non-specific endonuclease [Flavobacterium faecale]|uniref:DNA/RNA non-specific endonuclease n=1 Tax=Flavobacterium faecale TaxID=1355330 RepID=UPI003AB0540C